jgi:hypothetical protein
MSNKNHLKRMLILFRAEWGTSLNKKQCCDPKVLFLFNLTASPNL